MVSGAQIRSARALLAITAQELADASGVGWATIQRFETVDGVPAARGGTLRKVKSALEAMGVEFLGDPVHSPGVQLRRTDEA